MILKASNSPQQRPRQAQEQSGTFAAPKPPVNIYLKGHSSSSMSDDPNNRSRVPRERRRAHGDRDHFLAVAQCGLDLGMKEGTFCSVGSGESLPPISLSPPSSLARPIYPLVSLALNPFLPPHSLQVKPRRRLEKDIRRIREKRKGSQATALGDSKFPHRM